MITSTTIINRLFDGQCKELCDREVGMKVTAFPIERADDMLRNGRLLTAGAYILLGSGRAHAGESRMVSKRLRRQIHDAAKSFTRFCYVVTELDGVFSKQDVVHLQACLDAAIEDAGIVELVKGQEPWPADLPEWRIAELDRLLPRILRMLGDAGCYAVADRPHWLSDPAADLLDDGDMEIGASPDMRSVEREAVLEYLDFRARGYERVDGSFVVLPGSEIRKEENRSIIQKIRTRRRRLLAGDLTSKIPGVTDRERLNLAVGFPSKAIAAKVLSGAHLRTDNWTIQ